MSTKNAIASLMRSPFSAGRELLRHSPMRRLVVDLRHRGLTEEDVLLASYPKSGNTWLRHLVTYLATRKPTDWRDQLQKVSHRVGKHASLPKLLPGGGRLVKTHEIYRPEYRRAVVLVRDGRDVAVSEFHHLRDYVGSRASDLTFADFLESFLAGEANAYGVWHKHAASWVDGPAEHGAEVVMVRYEELKRDPAEQLRRIAHYLRIDADEELINESLENGSIESMRAKEKEYWASRGEPDRTFVRSAKAGNWRDVFTPELHDRFLEVAGDAMRKCGYSTEFPSPAPAPETTAAS